MPDHPQTLIIDELLRILDKLINTLSTVLNVSTYFSEFSKSMLFR